MIKVDGWELCVECSDCGQLMVVGTPTGRCDLCQREHAEQLAIEYERWWAQRHPETIKKPRRVRRPAVGQPSRRNRA